MNGEEYTPRSLAQFIAGLQRYISEKKETPVCLTDSEHPVFKSLYHVLENRYRQLYAQGIGAKRRQAEVITKDEKERLWEIRSAIK